MATVDFKLIGDEIRLYGDTDDCKAVAAQIKEAVNVAETDKGAKFEFIGGESPVIKKVRAAVENHNTQAVDGGEQQETTTRRRRMVDFYQAKQHGLNHGRPFRASEDHPSTHGISPDLVGEWVCYVYD